MRKKLYWFLPAIVAALNGLAIAIGTVPYIQPGYAWRSLAVEIGIVLSALLIAAPNRIVRGIGWGLTLIGIYFGTFSVMFLYIPTAIVATWILVRRGREAAQS